MYHIFGEDKRGEEVDFGIISEEEYKDLLKNPICGCDFIDVVKENGQHTKLMLSEGGYTVVYRGVKTDSGSTFLDYLQEKRRKKTPINPKFMQKDKGDRDGIKKPHHLKAARGTERKDQNYIPLYKRVEHKNALPSAQAVLSNAKESSSGIWKLSKRQVMEIAGKYKFNVPNKKEKTKHLGSTGILMWRKNKRDYYLVKFSKHKYLGKK